ncbi:MAG: hypothetical protein ACPIOQ_15885 [Promethearchaeia archaeon]
MHGADDDRHGEAASPWWSEESTRNFVVATPGMSSDDEAAWSDHEVRTARACEREPRKACGEARQAPQCVIRALGICMCRGRCLRGAWRRAFSMLWRWGQQRRRKRVRARWQSDRGAPRASASGAE